MPKRKSKPTFALPNAGVGAGVDETPCVGVRVGSGVLVAVGAVVTVAVGAAAVVGVAAAGAGAAVQAARAAHSTPAATRRFRLRMASSPLVAEGRAPAAL